MKLLLTILVADFLAFAAWFHRAGNDKLALGCVGLAVANSVPFG